MDSADRILGVLLGTAVGDALGLPCEGMSARTIRRRFGRVDRYRFLFRVGVVSDDTELSALVTQSLIRSRGNLPNCQRLFRRALLGWFLRLPWGIGWSTLRACLRLALGMRNTGRPSAGNGAAMRAAPIGAFLPDQPDRRRALGRALAQVTHTDPRAVAGALFVADLTAAAVASHDRDPHRAFDAALEAVDSAPLRERLLRARELARAKIDPVVVADEIGVGGFVLESVPLAAYCLLAFGDNPLEALVRCVSYGGDTDSTGAILGAWLGGLRGAAALPAPLVDQLMEGPFGRHHLTALATALAAGHGRAPRFSWALAMLRNLALYPVVLAHGFRRLVPF